MLVVGLTGDVGAGKSTVSSVWASEGAHIVNADLIVSGIWKRGDIASLAVNRWGEGILTSRGLPDHTAISRVVFGDEKEYRWVCDTIHPLVRREMESRVKALKGWVVAEIPLLFENGVPAWVDLTVYIEAPAAMRKIWNASRGWSEGELERRERWLLEASRKKELADFVIRNFGSLEDLTREARVLGRGFLSASGLVRVCFVTASSNDSRRLFCDLSRSVLTLQAEVAPSDGCEPSAGGTSEPALVVSAVTRSSDLEEVEAIARRSCANGIVRSRKEEAGSLPREVLIRAMGCDV